MPIKPPTYNYGGSQGTMGLIAQAMANRYRSSPAQQFGFSLALQGQQQAAQARENELARQYRTLESMSSWERSLQEGIASGAFVTEETAEADPALRGRIGEIRRIPMSILGLPSMDILTEEQLARVQSRPPITLLDKAQVNQIRAEYDPFENVPEGTLLDRRDLDPYQWRYLAQNPGLAGSILRAEPEQIALLERTLEQSGNLGRSMLEELRNDINENRLSMDAASAYGEAYDALIKREQLNVAQGHLSLGWRELEENVKSAAETRLDRLALEWSAIVPEGTTAEQIQTDGSVLRMLPNTISRALAEIQTFAETPIEGENSRLPTDEEVRVKILQVDRRIGNRAPIPYADGDFSEYDLEDLYHNYAPAPMDRMNFVPGGRPDTAGKGATSGEQALVRMTPLIEQAQDPKVFETWLGQNIEWLDQDLWPHIDPNKGNTNDLFWRALRAVAPNMPGTRKEAADQIHDSSQFQALMRSTPEAAAVLMSMHGNPFVGYTNGIQMLDTAIQALTTEAPTYFDRIPSTRFLAAQWAMYNALPNTEAFKRQAYGPDFEDTYQALKNAAMWAEQVRISGTPGPELQERGDEVLRGLQTAQYRLTRDIMADVDSSEESLLREAINNQGLSALWLNPPREIVEQWTQPQRDAHGIARVILAMSELDDAARNEEFDRLVGKVATASGEDVNVIIKLLKDIQELLPAAESGAADKLNSAIGGVIDRWDQSGEKEGLQELIRTWGLALFMVNRHNWNPIDADRRYDVSDLAGKYSPDRYDMMRGQVHQRARGGLGPVAFVW